MTRLRITKIFIFLLVVFLWNGNKSNAQESVFINTTKGEGTNVPVGYVPPLVSNGSLSMLIDFKGGLTSEKYPGNLTPGIYWAGRRYGPIPDGLIPYGYFEHVLTVNGKKYETPTTWKQTLDSRKAVVTYLNEYGDDLSVETTVFTHIDHDLIVIKKKITSKASGIRSAEVGLNYQFAPPGTQTLPRRISSRSVYEANSQHARFLYEADGYKKWNGVISLFSDKQIKGTAENQLISLSATVDFNKEKTAEITWYVLFSDSMDGADYVERTDQLQSRVRQSGFDAMLRSHAEQWEAYHAECFVQFPDSQLERVYNTAQYHLRANATKWSFPVGIYPNHWHGRYFGWDETFCFQALASSNHLSISKRCPEFRHKILPRALYRVAHYGNPGSFGARYPWEAMEDGLEGAPSPYGFWIDHVFHMSNIAVSAWLQYLYSDDLDYLKSTGYPVIMECARFFASHMVYENPDGSMFIGKCTDLERLGSAVQNPFMTSCGAIYNFEVAAEAAELLGVDEDERMRWKQMASKLKESLPHENNMYVPYLGCKEKSIASMGGLYPYPIFDSTNELQKNAAIDFYENGKASGNMYPMGVSICAWYAGWIASALALLGDKEIPASVLTDAARNAGHFGELFEINEPPEIINVPWFSTASGNYVYGINQMLLQCKNDQIKISPAVPDSWKDYSFKLACYGNLTSTVHVKGGKITNLILTPGSTNKEIYRTIIIPESLVDQREINKKANASIETKDGYCFINVKIENQLKLF